MDYETIQAVLTSIDRAQPAESCMPAIPPEKGVYSILVRSISVLPSELARYQAETAFDAQVIYVGKGCGAEGLRQRLTRQDLRHIGASTFLRSLGAALGYMPPRGSLRGKKNQRNYRFTAQDTAAIQRWIAFNLLVNFVILRPQDVDAYEKRLIRNLKPGLNTEHNPEPCVYLRAARDRCIAIARAAC